MPTTKITLLPAINALYDFKLTNEHFNNIHKFLALAPTSEAEEYDSLNNRIYYMLKTDKYLIRTGIYFNRFNSGLNMSHDIQILSFNNTSKDEIGADILNSITPEGDIRIHLHGGKKVIKKDEDDEEYENYEYQHVKINQLAKTDLPKLNKLFSCLCDTPDLEHKLNLSKFEFNTVQDFILEIKQDLFNNIERTNADLIYSHRDESFINDFISIFVDSNAKHSSTKITAAEKKNLKLGMHHNMYFIYEVYEENNNRIFKTVYDSAYYTYNNNTPDYKYTLGLIPHTHPMYNYVDVGRYYITSDSSLHRDSGGYIFTDSTPIFPTAEVMRAIYGDNPKTITLVTNNDLKFATKRYAQEVDQEKNKLQAQDALAKKIKIKLAELELPNGQLKINDVIFKHDSFEYQGQEIVLNNKKHWVKDFLEILLRYYKFSDINFDAAFDKWLSEVHDAYGMSGKIGDVEFKLDKIETRNKSGISTSRIEINDIRINQSEVSPCLERALCFKKQSDYDSFLKTVSACSLRMHHYLHNGVDINVRDYFTNETLQIKFPLVRKKNINYLKIDKDTFRIHDTNKLIKLGDTQSYRRPFDMMDVVNTLVSGDVVEDITIENLKKIIEAGKQAYQDSVNKSKKLLEDTEKLFNIQRQKDIQLSNNVNVSEGYIIKGSLRTYCIDAQDRCNVYTYPDGKYLCMVDKTNTQVGFDKLISRLYALHNDHLVVDQIDSLGE